jgi:hypothetical protein
VIFGTGGLGRETHEAVDAMVAAGEPIRFLGFLDGNFAKHHQQVHGAPVLGGPGWLKDRPDVEVVVAVGSPAVRQRLVRSVEALGHARFGTVVHPRAMVGRRVEVGEGSILLQGASVIKQRPTGWQTHL